MENGRKAIWTVKPDGSQQHKIIEDHELDSPRWSPAGDAIYFLHTSPGNTQELLKVTINPESGQAKDSASVLMSGLQIGGHFTVSTDGSRLAYSRSLHHSNLWLAQFRSPDDGKVLGKELQTSPLTTGTSSHDSPAISPNGKWIAFVSEGHIYKMPMEGGPSVQLTYWNATDVSPAWSPDGERVAFGSKEGGSYNVWTVDAYGANRQRFAKTQLSETDKLGPITWSPGRHILYHRPGNRNFNILNPETGEEKPLVQNESAGGLFTPKYSPDGRKVAVYWNRPPQRGLWVISLIDNSETFLGEESIPAGWSPDGSSIYAYSDNNMLSIPVGRSARRSPHTVFTIPGDYKDASVSADGKRFVFSSPETKSDVWLAENFDPTYRK